MQKDIPSSHPSPTPDQPQTGTPKEWFTLKEAAQYLGTSTERLQKFIDAKKVATARMMNGIPHFHISALKEIPVVKQRRWFPWIKRG